MKLPENRARDKALGFYWKHDDAFLSQLSLSPGRRKYESARAAILMDARIEAEGKGRDTSYSRNANYYAGRRQYNGSAYTFRNIVPAVDELVEMGFLATDIAPPIPGWGRQSVLRATPKLQDVPAPSAIFVPPALIFMKDKGGHLTEFSDTLKTRRMRRNLEEINEALRGSAIALDTPDAERRGSHAVFQRDGGEAIVCMAKDTLFRVFNESWKHGGRLYGPYWQNIPSQYRDDITLDGEPVAEADYSNQHAHLAYHLAGKKLDGDAYDLRGWERRDAKIAFQIMLNAPTYESAVRAIADKLFRGQLHEKAKALIDALKTKHTPIAELFHTGIGLRLQNIDAEIMEGVLLRLLKRGIVALPVHDSAIVKASKLGALKEEMERATHAAGVGYIPLETKHKTPNGITKGVSSRVAACPL